MGVARGSSFEEKQTMAGPAGRQADRRIDWQARQALAGLQPLNPAGKAAHLARMIRWIIACTVEIGEARRKRGLEGA